MRKIFGCNKRKSVRAVIDGCGKVYDMRKITFYRRNFVPGNGSPSDTNVVLVTAVLVLVLGVVVIIFSKY